MKAPLSLLKDKGALRLYKFKWMHYPHLEVPQFLQIKQPSWYTNAS